MRFVDVMTRMIAIGALCAGASGCASLGDVFQVFRGSNDAGTASSAPSAKPQSTGGNAAAVSGATTAAKTVTPAVASTAPRADEPAVSPSVQRAFDNARAALAAGRLTEAERGFRALTVSNPELGGPYASLGMVYRLTGKLDDAVSAFEQATRLSPRQAQYFNQLGITYRMAGQFTKARDAYERALSLQPNYAGACLNLGILYDLYLWDGKRALEYYDRYQTLVPGGDPTVTKWVADLKNRKSQQQAAASPKEQP